MSEGAAPPRLAQMPGVLRDLVGRVAETEITTCLLMLSISAIDVADLGALAVVADALTQWREQGRVSPSTLAQAVTAQTRFETEAAAAQRDDDITTQRDAFTRARALHCLSAALRADQPPSYRLAEAAYEASIAMGSTAGVVAILVDFVE